MSFDWWTLGLQAINFAVLAWLLGRVLWRPVAAAIADRRAEAQRLLDDAASRRDAATVSQSEAEAARAGIAAERAQALAEARAAAESDRRAILDKARAEAAALAAAAAAQRQAEAEAAEAAYAARASELALDIARRIGAGLAGPGLAAAYLDRMVRRIEVAPDRNRLAADGPVSLACAVPPAAADTEALLLRLSEALGKAAKITIFPQPDLICGYAITTPHFSVESSFSGDLDRIRREIADG